MNNEDCFISNVIFNCCTKHKFLKYLLGGPVVRVHKGKKETVSCAHLTEIYLALMKLFGEVCRYTPAGFNLEDLCSNWNFFVVCFWLCLENVWKGQVL